MSARYDTNDLSYIFRQGVQKGATHMFVMYERTGITNNRYDYNDYHYYVMPGEDAREAIQITLGLSHRCPKLMEVYNLHMPMEQQLRECRACNF